MQHPTTLRGVVFYTLQDRDFDDVQELGVFGFDISKNRYQLLVHSGASGAKLGAWNWPAALGDVSFEALADLINANTEKQRELALSNLEGTLSNYSLNLSIKLKKLLANVEAIIDFVDEDLPINIRNNIIEQNKNIIQSIEKTISHVESDSDSLITVYWGDHSNENQSELENKLIDRFSSIEMEFQYGGQSNIEAWVVIE